MRRPFDLAILLFALSGLVALAPPAADGQGVGLASLLRAGSPAQVREALSKGASATATLPDGESPLAEAAASNPNPAVIVVLIQSGARVDARDGTGMTPLMWAAAENPNPAVLSALIASGSQVDAKNVIGMTALMFAAKDNTDSEVLKRLIDAGASVDSRNIDGMTALMYAASDGASPAVLTDLLRAGADVGAKDSAGRNAFDYAETNRALIATPALAELATARPQGGVRAQGDAQYASSSRRLLVLRSSLPKLEEQHSAKVKGGLLLDGLGLVSGGAAALLYFLAAQALTSYQGATTPQSALSYRDSFVSDRTLLVIAGGVGLGLVVTGVILPLTWPSEALIDEMKRSEVDLDRQLHELGGPKAAWDPVQK